jgi:hypothetical protein
LRGLRKADANLFLDQVTTTNNGLDFWGVLASKREP